MDESGQRDVGIRWEELNSRYARAANSFVQFAAAAQDAQIKSFQSGRRHALGELRRWILEGQQRSEVTEEDIVAYIKNELGYDEVGPVGVLSQSQHPSSDANMQNHAPYVSMPGGEQPANNVMFPATPASALTETPYPLVKMWIWTCILEAPLINSRPKGFLEKSIGIYKLMDKLQQMCYRKVPE